MLGIAAAAAAAGVRAQAEPEAVRRIGDYVERYYTRAHTIVADEAVVLQPLGRDLSFVGFPRRLQYEVRLEWNPDAETPDEMASIARKLISATGPRLGPPDRPDCLDPVPFSPDTLAFLLPGRRSKFRFTMAGTDRLDGRLVLRVDYRPVKVEPPTVTWKDECGNIDLPFGVRGRIFVDPITSEILRLEEGLTGQFELPPAPRRGGPIGDPPVLERSTTTTVYTRVAFQDPPETVLLPSAVDSVTVIRRSGMPQLRVTQRYANYRRFVTSSRIIE